MRVRVGVWLCARVLVCLFGVHAVMGGCVVVAAVGAVAVESESRALEGVREP